MNKFSLPVIKKLKLPEKIPGAFFIGFSVLVFLVAGNPHSFAQEKKLKVTGIVKEKGKEVIPFAYVIVKNTNTGTVSGIDGAFEIYARPGDTLIFSHLGYFPGRVVVGNFFDTSSVRILNLELELIPKAYELKQVQIRNFEFTKEEKDYYKRKIDAPKPTIMSPVSALYYQFSREGKSLRKLEELYNGLLIEEMVEERLSDEMVRRITGKKDLTREKIRYYCGLSDQYIISASDYDLYKRVRDCSENQRRKK